MIVKLEQFNGRMPRLAPHLLPPTFAQTATNVKLVSGGFEPWREPEVIAQLYKTGEIKSLYYYENAHWFHFLDDTDVVRGPVALDAYKRAYWTSSAGVPQYVVWDDQTGPDYPTKSYDLGIPPGDRKPTRSFSGSPSTTDKRLYESRVYVFTFVSAYGEEGMPSEPSSIITWKPGQTLTIGNLGTSPPDGNYNITKKRLYRTNTGTNGTNFQMVVELDIDENTYEDNVESANLGQILPSATWAQPPEGLQGLVSLPCGSLCGFTSNREVCFSEPYRPHAWPTSYRIPVEDRIVGLGVFGSTVAVLTKGFPWVVTGEHPEAMSREKLEIGEICMSKLGIADLGYYLMYPSPSGLILVSSDNIENATEKIMSRDDWLAYNPSSIRAYNLRGLYVGFYDTGTVRAGFVFDPKTGDFTDLEMYATAGFSDPDSGELYLVTEENDLCRFDPASGSTMVSTWKSKPFFSDHAVNLGVAQVKATAYDETLLFNLYGDGELRHSHEVAGPDPFRLPSGYLAEEWEVEVLSSHRVSRVYVAPTIDDLRKARFQGA